MPSRLDAEFSRRSWLATLGAVAATYVYFLIFAEFALLEIANGIAANRLRLVMTMLGAGGAVGSFIAAKLFSSSRQNRLMSWSFRACALAAVGAWQAQSLALIVAIAALAGISLGALTVVLSASLRSTTHDKQLGICVGAGTGLAYAACNLPGLFHATPAHQAIAAAAVVGTASFLPRWLVELPTMPDHSGPFARSGNKRWLIALLALVWLDSAAFYIVQHTATLREATWHTPAALLANALTHLFAAVAAGALLDRGARPLVAAGGAAALALACLALNATLPATFPPAWLYTAGVSLYSVVLVEYPARSGRPRLAALVFAIAGWIGSGLGIGMAQDLARVPTGFVIAALVAIGGALFLRSSPRTRLALAILVGLTFIAGVPRACADELDRATQITLGREVYIAEGCIHCHSQFIRPLAPIDIQRWGPAEPFSSALAGAPPLVGTRRQGPDLSHVGNRRSAEWNRLHLIAPRAISPGSRMPSYQHLFAHGDPRGDALVAYLTSLGAGTKAERQAQIAAWQPDTRAALSLPKSQQRFQQLCLPCHGEAGRGDGPLARQLSYPPPDWSRSPWRHIPPGTERETALCRIVKFGLPGLPMAGHEYLPDADVVGLARYVQTLHNERSEAISAALQP